MKNNCSDEIVYSISVSDIQNVAEQVLGRALTKQEVISVENSIGDYLDWFQAVENSIRKKVKE